MGAEGQKNVNEQVNTEETGVDAPVDATVRGKMEQCLQPATPEFKSTLEALNNATTQQALYEWALTLPEHIQAKALSTFFVHYPDYKLTPGQRETREIAENRNVTKEEVYQYANESLVQAKEKWVDAHVTDLFKADYELNKTAMTSAMVREFEATAYTQTLLPSLRAFLAKSTYKPAEQLTIEKNFHTLVVGSFRTSFAEGPGHQFAFLATKNTWDVIGRKAKGKPAMERAGIIAEHSRALALRTGLQAAPTPSTPDVQPAAPTAAKEEAWTTITTEIIKGVANVGAITWEQLWLTAETYPDLCENLEKPATPEMKDNMWGKFEAVFSANHLDVTGRVLRRCEEVKAWSTVNTDAIILPAEKEFAWDIPKTFVGVVDGVTPTEYGKRSTKLALKNTTETVKWRAESIKEFISDIAGPEWLKILQEQGIGAFIMHIFWSDMSDADKQKVQEVVMDPAAVIIGKEYANNPDAKPKETLDEAGDLIADTLNKDDTVVVHPMTSFNGFTRYPDKKILMKAIPTSAAVNPGGAVYLDTHWQEIAVPADKVDGLNTRPQDAVDLSEKTDQTVFLLAHIHNDILQKQIEAKFGTDRTLNMPADFRRDEPYKQEDLMDPTTGPAKTKKMMNDLVSYELKKLMTKDNKFVLDGTVSLVTLLTHDIGVWEVAVNAAATSLSPTLYDTSKQTFGALPAGAEYMNEEDGKWTVATADAVNAIMKTPDWKVQLRMPSAPRYVQTYKNA